jgi:endonuclease YncB( thermonuclease family)
MVHWLTILIAAAALPAATSKADKAAPPPPPPPPEVRTRTPAEAFVVDGSAVSIRTFRVVLTGVEVLERSQQCERAGRFEACGQYAARRLASLIQGRDVACAIVADLGRPDVLRGRCFAGGVDLAQVLVDEGLAVGLRGTVYGAASLQACLARRGAWAGAFEAPWTVRARAAGDAVAPKLLGLGAKTPCASALRG